MNSVDRGVQKVLTRIPVPFRLITARHDAGGGGYFLILFLKIFCMSILYINL